jgi:TusA-related sulfurtransferase
VSAPAAAAPLDLRAYACPLTWVKTRIALERLDEGSELEVLLSSGEPAESVPRSAEEDGHRVLAVVALGVGEGVRLVLRKQGRGGEAWR